LRGVRNILAEDEFLANPIVQLLVLERRDGCPPVKRMFGIGDGDPADSGAEERWEPTTNVTLRVSSRPQDDRADRVFVMTPSDPSVRESHL